MGSLQNLLATGKHYADIRYREVGGTSNHQVFSQWVNDVGLDGEQNAAWCATMQFALEIKEYGVDTALKHWHMNRKNYCGYSVFSTRNMFPASKRTDRFHPVLGALVIYSYSHMGRVYKVYSDGSFDSLEGNTTLTGDSRNGGYVAIKHRSRGYSKVSCFCVIDYDEADTKAAASSVTQAGRNWLQIGDSGELVKELQENLIKLGYSCGSYGADGDFGKATYNALVMFQKGHGLEADGEYGVKSKSAMSNAISELAQKVVTKIPVPEYKAEASVMPASKVGVILDNANNGGVYMFNVKSVSMGSKGTSVLLLQEILKARDFYKGALDQSCGTGTVNAINAYQSARRAQGTEVGTNGHNDGCCGAGMWKDLLAL
jgi:peptidoglycan hydrolase-like protein with peptidoglycan-binding domain